MTEERVHNRMACQLTVPVMMLEKNDQQERERLRSALMKGLDDCLTPTQRRRLWLYCIEGMTEDEIALAENVRQQSISECIMAAKEKIKKFMESTL